jgi:hypothetical protein
MKDATKLRPWLFLGAVIAIVGCFSVFPTAVLAQGLPPNQGNNAVYYQSGSSGTCCQGSGAFIDASVFTSLTQTVCQTLYDVLVASSYPSTGTVIDARGLNSTNTNMTCAAGWTPWNNGATFLDKSSTILLPAGTIVIPTPWVLPQYAHLIGVGDSIVSASGTWTTSGTTIQACKSSSPSCTFSGDMIDFGGSPACSSCTDISIENLALDGQGQSINGIVNQYSQALT